MPPLLIMLLLVMLATGREGGWPAALGEIAMADVPPTQSMQCNIDLTRHAKTITKQQMPTWQTTHA
jgi:hypothetical protein